jgi:hypothetical protein
MRIGASRWGRAAAVAALAIGLSGCGTVGRMGTQVREWWTLHSERRALIALYEATDGENWSRNDRWLTATPITGIEAIDYHLDIWSVCDWYGVSCGATSGRIVSLSLSLNNLSGAVPPEIGRLHGLQELYLGDNQLTSLPPEIGQLTNLRRLYLEGNQLTSLPPEVCALGAEISPSNLCDE